MFSCKRICVFICVYTTANALKHGGDNLFSRLHQLITNAWEVGSVPQAWKDASIVTIYKKGDRTDCGNYRGICLLSIAGKIFARILLNRLSIHITPEVVPETQCGFRGNRSTVGMICCLQQLQENCIEQDRPLDMVFVDFSKAFHDSALVVHSAEEMQKVVNVFSDASKKYGKKINIKKTEVLYQPNSTIIREEDIMVDGNKLNSVLEFTYLGGTISSNGRIDDEIQRRMAKASTYFGRLRQRLWNNHHVSMRVKGKIYRAIVLSTLLYGAEAWAVYRRQVKNLHAFMMRDLRSIMRIISGMDKVTNKEVLERTGLPSVEDLLIRKNLRWTGHLMRMSPGRLPKQIIYSQLSSGHRKRGHPRLRFKDTIKINLKLRDIKTYSWTSFSQHRDKNGEQ